MGRTKTLAVTITILFTLLAFTPVLGQDANRTDASNGPGFVFPSDEEIIDLSGQYPPLLVTETVEDLNSVDYTPSLSIGDNQIGFSREAQNDSNTINDEAFGANIKACANEPVGAYCSDWVSSCTPIESVSPGQVFWIYQEPHAIGHVALQTYNYYIQVDATTPTGQDACWNGCSKDYLQYDYSGTLGYIPEYQCIKNSYTLNSPAGRWTLDYLLRDNITATTDTYYKTIFLNTTPSHNVRADSAWTDSTQYACSQPIITYHRFVNTSTSDELFDIQYEVFDSDGYRVQTKTETNKIIPRGSQLTLQVTFNAPAGGWSKSGKYGVRAKLTAHTANGNDIEYTHAVALVPFAPCPVCTAHSSSACFDNDVYWYNSCSVREGIRTECGDTTFGANFCQNNDVYRNVLSKGCSNNSCYQNNGSELVQDCGSYGCSNGACNTCTSHASTVCTGNNLVWRNSCGQAEEVKETCRVSCLSGYTPNQCDNGCLGQFDVRVKDKWNQPLANATVSFSAGYAPVWKFAGQTDSAGHLQFQDIQPTPGNNYACSFSYALRVVTQNGTDCGTINTRPNAEGDSDAIRFVCPNDNFNLNTILLSAGTNQATFDRGQAVTFFLSAQNLLLSPVSNVLIGVLKDYSAPQAGSATTGADGKTVFTDTPPQVGAYKYRFIASKTGYRNGYTEQAFTVKDCVNDFDCDGFTDDIERLAGTSPNNATDNPYATPPNALSTCASPLGWILGGIDPAEKNQILQNLRQLNSQQLETLSDPLHVSDLGTQELTANAFSGASAIDANTVPIREFFDSGDQLEYFSTDATMVFLFYSDSNQTLTIYSFAPLCTGFFIGTPDGAWGGIQGDIDFGHAVLTGTWDFVTKLDQIPTLAEGVSQFVGTIPQLLGSTDSLVKDAMSGIYKQAQLKNPSSPHPGNTTYRHFQNGYLQGFITGYVAEQITVGIVTSTAVAQIMEKLALGAKIAQVTNMFAKGLSAITTKVGAFTANILREAEWARPIIQAGEKAAAGLGRLTKALGNNADNVKVFLGDMTESAQIAFNQKIETLYTRLETICFSSAEIHDQGLCQDLAQLSDNLLAKNSRAWKTILNYFPEDVQEGVLKALKKGTIDDSDELLHGMARYDNATKQAFGITDATDIAKFPAGQEKHQVIKAMKAPSVSTKITTDAGQTIEQIDGFAVLKKGVKENWGYDHIFDYIRPNETTTRAQQIRDSFGLANDQGAVLDLISEGLKKGNKEAGSLDILYTDPRTNKALRIGIATDSPGSIQTIRLGG
jgi:hypothetical protein